MVPHLHITAPSGSSSSFNYTIGQAHGTHFATHVRRSIAFYTRLFFRTTGLTWAQVCVEAVKFLPVLESDGAWRAYVEEMRGVADGAGEDVEFDDVLALNVRTEVAYGMAKGRADGCTALYWREEEREEEGDCGRKRKERRLGGSFLA